MDVPVVGKMTGCGSVELAAPGVGCGESSKRTLFGSGSKRSPGEVGVDIDMSPDDCSGSRTGN